MDEIIYHSDKTSKKKIVVNEKKIVLQTEEESVEKQNIEIDTLFASADKEKGLKLSKQCQACHDFSNNLKIKLGPPLWGVVGRDTAIIADFKYSKAFLNLKKTWSRQELFYFLEKPNGYVEGTKMIYKGLSKIGDRVNLISYLESLK
tara:strand:+ start:183 stop:623 length:441 start_codon:yes stop_codon:yes gene_type:complete